MTLPITAEEIGAWLRLGEFSKLLEIEERVPDPREPEEGERLDGSPS